MATRSKTPSNQRLTFRSGPWKGVRDVLDPYEDAPDLLIDLQNCFIWDAANGSGASARRGFGILNLQAPYTGRGQCVFDHIVAGQSYNFVIVGGKILRANQGLTTFTDVTPTVPITALPFLNGTLAQPSVGDVLQGLTSGATGTVVTVTDLAGDVSTSNESGWFTITPGTGAFLASEELINVTHPPKIGGYLPFTGGTGTEPIAGDTLVGASTGASGTVVSVLVTGGSFGANNAIGNFVLTNVVGAFSATESITDASTTIATANGLLVGVIGQTNGLAQTTMATISPTATHVFCRTFGEQLIISDGVNPPWIASNLDQTPITGTIIDYDGTGMPGSGDPWSARGQPVVYSGSLFFIVQSVNSVVQPPTITWSAPGNPSQGYQQDDGMTNDFAYFWVLEQTNAHPLYGLAATNTALFYFRDYSIGAVAGTPGPDFQGSVTSDVVSENIGCLQSATIQQYGQTIFFCDAIGRPFALQSGSPPIPLWLNLRAIVNNATTEFPGASAQVAIATIHPILDLYIVAPWSPLAGTAAAPTEAYCFDVQTLAYVGRWSIRNGATWEAMGILNDTAGYASLIVLGNEPPYDPGDDSVLGTQDGKALGTQDGFALGLVNTTIGRTGVIWGMDATSGDGIPISSEDGLFIISSEDGIEITSENQLVSWLDDGVPPTRSFTTFRAGYSPDTIYNFDQATIITQDSASCTVTATTPTVANTLEGTPVPPASQDGTYRLVCGLDLQGRGCELTVSPTTALDQWIAQSVSIVAIPALAGPDEA